MTKKSTKEKDVIDQILDQLDLHGMTQEELFGADGLAKKLTARLLNKALEAEMDTHLGHAPRLQEAFKRRGWQREQPERLLGEDRHHRGRRGADKGATGPQRGVRAGDSEEARKKASAVQRADHLALLQGDDDKGHTVAPEGDLRRGCLP